MKKIILFFIISIFCMLNVHAKPIKADFDGIIKDFGIDKDSISISIKNLKTGDTVYSINDKILRNPASVQKIYTMPAVIDALGEDYKFKTELYQRDENSYLIKLGGDPYLKSSDLKTLINPVKIQTTQMYIDDTVLDSKTWGEGWQWDDEMNTLMPRFSSYNLDKNLIKINIIPSSNGRYATIVNPSKYPFMIDNKVTTSNKTAVEVKRNTDVSLNAISLSGTVARQTTIVIPSNNLKRYFEIQLTRALENHKVYIKNPYKLSTLKSTDVLLQTVEHDLTTAINDVLKNSNNMTAETVFKLSGRGSDIGGIKVFNEYCNKNNIDNSGIKITDGSGVSKNNLTTADFVSEFLVKSKDSKAMDYLPTAGEGTLTQRMLPLKDVVKAKTGTLSGISSIAGYLTSKKGAKYAFCIIQNDVKLSSSDKKMLEDYIIREAYLKL